MTSSPIRFSEPIDTRTTELYSPDQFSIQPKYVGHLEGIRVPGGLVKNRIRRLSEHVSNYDFGEEMVLACMLKGAMPFHSEMQKKITKKTRTALYGASSYHGAKSTGEVNVYLFNPKDFEDRHVVLIEDISESGLTLAQAQKDIGAVAKSLTTIVLFDKPDAERLAHPQIDGVGLIIPHKEFVVGGGLDYNGKYRDLYHLGVLKDKHK